MKRLFRLVIGFVIFFQIFAATAQEISPDVLIKNITNEVLDIVRHDTDIRSGNTRKAIELIELKMAPHANFTRMTSLAVGKDWRQTTADQRKILVDEFRTLLVRTYAKSLTEYRNQTPYFKPFKMHPTETEVIVRTEVRQSGSKPIQLDYELEKQEDGEWKVFDIYVAGISLVTNYRNSFSQEISAGGIAGLIASLRTKNTQVAKK
ncbi:MAG: ABC transporter substrate-binding protein [Rhodocyclaceae bacterium]|nr:ABC transporter substrate-binding protein [Rhodocyclaceae bacterium]